MSDKSREELEERVDELEATVKKMLPSRRQVLKGSATAAGAGMLGFSAGNASAQASTEDGDGNVGDPDNRVDVFANGVSAEGVNDTIRIVGNGGYDSIMAAYNDLPGTGGMVFVSKASHAETDIVFERGKTAKLVGLGNSRANDGGTDIDTSGGNGIHLQGDGHVLRDFRIVGDSDQWPTSFDDYYGIRIGETSGYLASLDIDNVGVDYKGVGVQYIGSMMGSEFDINVYRCNLGHHVDTSEGDRSDGTGYSNQNVWNRLSANYVQQEGLRIDGAGRFVGNVVNQFHIENAGQTVGTAWDVSAIERFTGNQINGYGIEGGAGTQAVDLDPSEGEENIYNTAVGPQYTDLTFNVEQWSEWRSNQPSYVDGMGVVARQDNSIGQACEFADGIDVGRVTVPPGTYGSFDMYPGMTVEGVSDGDVLIQSSAVAVNFNNQTANESTLRNVSVENTGNNNQAIYVPGAVSGVHIDDVKVVDASRAGIRVDGNNNQISNCDIEGVSGSDAAMRILGDENSYNGNMVNGTIEDTGTGNEPTNVEY